MLSQDSEHDLKLDQYISDLDKMPRTALMRVLSSAKETLKNILVRGEYSDYPDEEKMHCRDRLAEMLNKCLEELQSKSPENRFCGEFLMEEIKVLEETNGIALPPFFSPTAFVTIFENKVDQVAEIPMEFMQKVWNYVEEVVVRVILEKFESYLQLQSHTRRACHNLMLKLKTRSLDRVKEIVKMEKFGGYSASPEYLQTWNRLMLEQKHLMKILNDTSKPTKLNLELFGEVEVGHLRENISFVEHAFDLKMRLTAYWRIVLRRLVDNLALYLSFSIQNLVTGEMEAVIVNEIMGGSGGGGGCGIKRMSEESPHDVNKKGEVEQEHQAFEVVQECSG